VADVQLRCEIDGCTASWTVRNVKLMKTSMDAHRAEFHPAWVKPETKPTMTAYALQYTNRARQF
jgi:hypothetical protein